MKTIINPSTNPYFNLALEEYVLKHLDLDEDVFFLWRNDPCVVIGRNQNPFNEINIHYTSSHNIPILRRISGGGTVYHDHGNVNFTFITSTIQERLNNYEFFIHPLIAILQKTGVPARFVPSSHIYINDTKISGNAQSFYKNKMMHHGTLLFESDLTHLKNVLHHHKHYNSKAVSSTRASTTNIKNHMTVSATIEEFMDFILNEYFIEDYHNHIVELNDEDIKQINKIMNDKYHSWSWNLGETPEFWINEEIDGEIIQMRIHKGIVQESSFYPEDIEGLRFVEEELQERLPDSEHAKLHQLFQ
ncbi:lipoate--protein ligase family protein [Candidatus Xianfuyuplasma coldseepsis]|uniref:Lipoate--protein ligase n=1 Tax=Candidatus Xianfuyuplasma coldseepsis TaxID=2782163 RepID=A0A7L7KNZ8_9MOLU|nr:lipoate--protein ligase [Xianfuyuplasma coldseepsis]QMS84501.1 lipoate--protein ligase [Xianfuyuplasma coldseepsis]